MKRAGKRLTILLLTAALLMALAAPAQAVGNVIYDGNSRDFIILPGTQSAPTSLFASFTDLMPGDTVTETVMLQHNSGSDKMDVTVWLRALGADEESKALLSQLKLTVKQGEGIRFEAPADQTAQLTDWVCLGTMKNNGRMALEVTLEVPITLDDRFQSSAGSFVWEFRAEEVPAPVIPQTGDSFHWPLYVLLLGVSAAGVAVLLLVGRRKREKDAQ